MNGRWFLYEDKATYWCRFAAQKPRLDNCYQLKQVFFICSPPLSLSSWMAIMSSVHPQSAILVYHCSVKKLLTMYKGAFKRAF